MLLQVGQQNWIKFKTRDCLLRLKIGCRVAGLCCCTVWVSREARAGLGLGDGPDEVEKAGCGNLLNAPRYLV
jgi:hypothetical protein